MATASTAQQIAQLVVMQEEAAAEVAAAREALTNARIKLAVLAERAAVLSDALLVESLAEASQ